MLWQRFLGSIYSFNCKRGEYQRILHIHRGQQSVATAEIARVPSDIFKRNTARCRFLIPHRTYIGRFPSTPIFRVRQGETRYRECSLLTRGETKTLAIANQWC